MRLNRPVRMLAITAGLLRSQWWDRGRIAAYQERRLVELLQYAVEHVPFYAALGISTADIRSATDLHRFPIVTKTDIQERGDHFLSREFAKRDLNHSRSSGMTGEPTTTYFDENSWLVSKYALKARRVLVTASSLRQRILIVSERNNWPSLPKLVRLFVDIEGISLGEAIPIKLHLEKLVHFAPTVIYGFPSYLVALVDAAAEEGLSLPPVPLICTSSEILTELTRKTLERAFHGRVVDVYGSTEFKEIAVQCSHNRYHLNFESVHVESVTESGNGIPKLLVTTLLNKAMPLIRYELGDTGRLGQADCACGRSSPWLFDLHGRICEMLDFPDGTRLSPYVLETVIEQEPGIRYFRIVHEQPWSLRVEALTRPALSESSRLNLTSSLQKILPAQASLKLVDLAERGKRGKRRTVLREF